MGLTARLLRSAASRPPTLVVTAPGGTRARLGVERELRRRGWPDAAAPSGAALLVVCGFPGTALSEAVGVVWREYANPRAFAQVPCGADAAQITAVLGEAAQALGDAQAQRSGALARVRTVRSPPSQRDEDSGHEDSVEDHAGHDSSAHSGSSHGQARPDGSAQNHADHDGPAHGYHMGASAGPGMADRGEDRDGLKLDRLHVPLGPALPHWPAGLIVDTVLQGDVIQHAEVSMAEGLRGSPFWDEPWLAARAGEPVTGGEAARRRAAAHLDGLGRLLRSAGWESAAVRARGLRDDMLAEVPARRLTSAQERFARRVRGSLLLRWMLHDVGVVGAAEVERYGLTGPAARYPGDAHTRMLGRLTEVGESLAHADDTGPPHDEEGPRGPVGARPSAAILALLPSLLTGAELATAHLIVTSLDPDLDQLAVEAVDA